MLRQNYKFLILGNCMKLYKGESLGAKMNCCLIETAQQMTQN